MITVGLSGIPSDKTCVISGCLLRVDAYQLPLLTASQTRHALLITGDVTVRFRHLGHQKTKHLTTVDRTVSIDSKEARWISEIMQVIDELSVGALFVKGNVSRQLMDCCYGSGVVVVTSVPYECLVALSASTSAVLCTYVTECTQEYVARDLTMEAWRSDWINSTSSQHYVTVRPSASLVQTAVLCHPVSDMIHVQEDRLQHCLHRLSSLLGSRQVLLGAGHVESYCADRLDQLADDMEKVSDNEIGGFGDFAVDGLRAMAQGFRRYVDSVTGNPRWTATEVGSSDVCCSAGEIFDSWPEKMSAWRAALYVSSVVLQTDLEIVGTSSNSQPGRLQRGRLVVGHL